MASIDTGARNTEKWGKNKAYLTLLIAENQRIITNFAAQAKKNIEISGCAKREHRDFQRAKLLIIITYTQVSQRPRGLPRSPNFHRKTLKIA